MKRILLSLTVIMIGIEFSQAQTMEDAARRLSPVVRQLNLPLWFTPNATESISWDVMSYEDDDLEGLVQIKCPDTSGQIQVMSETDPTGTYVMDGFYWGPSTSSVRRFSVNFRFAPFLRTYGECQVRFFWRQPEANSMGVWLSTLIPNSDSRAYGQEGRIITRALNPNLSGGTVLSGSSNSGPSYYQLPEGELTRHQAADRISPVITRLWRPQVWRSEHLVKIEWDIMAYQRQTSTLNLKCGDLLVRAEGELLEHTEGRFSWSSIRSYSSKFSAVIRLPQTDVDRNCTLRFFSAPISSDARPYIDDNTLLSVLLPGGVDSDADNSGRRINITLQPKNAYYPGLQECVRCEATVLSCQGVLDDLMDTYPDVAQGVTFSHNASTSCYAGVEGVISCPSTWRPSARLLFHELLHQSDIGWLDASGTSGRCSNGGCSSSEFQAALLEPLYYQCGHNLGSTYLFTDINGVERTQEDILATLITAGATEEDLWRFALGLENTLDQFSDAFDLDRIFDLWHSQRYATR